jgi:hypothetical protein
MLALLSEIVEGGTPRVQDIMYLRAVLLTNTNLYQPMDLHRQLQAMDMEVREWTALLMVQACSMSASQCHTSR